MAAKVPEADGVGAAGGRVAVPLARFARGDGVDVGEADVVAVEAVRLVDLEEARVIGFDECDVDALGGDSVSRCFYAYLGR